jgi:hypothetical protein
MLMMKSLYMPGTTLVTNLQELAGREKYMSLLFFLISPVVLIILNAVSIRKIYFLSGSPKLLNFLQIVWLNVLVIVFSALIILIYLL